jgi:hypothetical protein
LEYGEHPENTVVHDHFEKKRVSSQRNGEVRGDDLVNRLFDFIEQLSIRLQDEVNRMKGKQGKPKIKRIDRRRSCKKRRSSTS